MGDSQVTIELTADEALVLSHWLEKLQMTDKSEAALAKLAGIAPVPTGSGMTSGRHRINHGSSTPRCTAPSSSAGKTKREIIRCLKRYVIREAHHLIRPAPRTLPGTS
ncbi:hypothetical protein ACFVW8_04445 [Streptomyces sp. NPDC058221]|uniref:hypothetical protein n=1 Tax=Streptomyces sp. NPDC058221 TaxID=3346388 RepID=UPI0036DFCC07